MNSKKKVMKKIYNMFDDAWDQVLANFELAENGLKDFINTGLSLKDAKKLIKEIENG